MVHYPLMLPGAKESAELTVMAPFEGSRIATVRVADEVPSARAVA